MATQKQNWFTKCWVIYLEQKRQIASLGQKLNIISLNNNKIFSVTKNIQLVEGDSIIKKK